MAVHCKSTGLMVGGRVLEETPDYWLFKATDEKRSKRIPKGDPKQKVFIGTSTRVIDQVEKWMKQWERK